MARWKTMARTVAVWAILASLCMGTIDGQRLSPAVFPSATPATAFPSARASVLPTASTGPGPWLEGAVIGGLITGVIATTLVWHHGFEGFVIGAVPGFILGGMIGSSFPKE